LPTDILRQPERAVPIESVADLDRVIRPGCTQNDEANHRLPRTFLNVHSSADPPINRRGYEGQLRVELDSSIMPRRTAEIGATSSLPRVPAKVPLPSDLPTFVIVHCKTGFVEVTASTRSVAVIG
jgi:hypothetical protein